MKGCVQWSSVYGEKISLRVGFSKGLKNEFETTMVNKPSVFEPLKVYCSWP